jgi:DNA-directed RNA polymerase subunit B
MAQDKNHTLVKEYLKGHSLVESNIKSFNNFLNQRLQEIVDEVSASIENDDFEIKLGKIEVGKPVIIEADGSTSHITPAEARIRNLNYSAPVTLEMTVKKDGQVDSEIVEIGRIPVLVGSDACNTNGMTKEELIQNFNDPKDPGGYFIINGNERVMVLAEDLAENQPFIEGEDQALRLRIFSLKGTYRIPVTIQEDKKGSINISFSRFKDIPAILILKALGLEREADIAKHIGKENDTLIINFYDFADIADKKQALLKMSEKTYLKGTEEEIIERVEQRIDSYLLPHIGLEKSDRREKAITLCKLIKQFLIAKENPKLRTDKDHYANKRVRLSGDLLTSLFRVNLGILVRDIKYSLQKSSRRKKFYSIKTIAKSTLFTHRIRSAVATGSWIGERTGVTQNMSKTNYLDTISQLQRVASMLPGEQENLMARTLHPTHYGRFCPIETPEGTEIGLRKNLALLAKVSTRVNINKKELVAQLKEAGLDTESEDGADVFLNGIFVGVASDETSFVELLREMRRQGKLPSEMSFRNDPDMKNVLISTEVGRVLRPLIILDGGQPRLTEEHLEKIRAGEMSWEEILKSGIIEYIDAAEEENALTALYEDEITKKHTHLEIDPVDLLGVITSLVPYANHDQSSRLNRGSKTQKQALGLYAANYLARLDTDVSVLEYPQKPIIRSFVYDTLDTYPAGQNLMVAIMTQDGYNMEDALIFNKGSLDRGVGRSFYFRPYSAVEMNYAGGLKDKIEIPDKDVSGYKTETSYRLLEDDGIIYPEAEAGEGDVLIGKVSPPKFLSESREISVRTQNEASETMRQEESGVIDTVFISEDEEGNRIVQVRTRDQRIPELGDKFATSHGQKGVVGRIMPEEDIPFTVNGLRPDVLFNPHGLPSRMTVGYLLELLAGKVAGTKGSIIDSTPFASVPKKELERQLEELGFRFDGKETMFSGVTGKQLKAKIFVGNMYYLKLKYMVKNKIHGRASGKIALLTRQPIEGRSRGGALRLGEMEQQALVAHGASLLLKERYDSDKVILQVCSKCGSVAIEDTLRGKTYCPICGSEIVEPIEISYAFKLLMEELQGMHIQSTFELKNKYDKE